MKPKLSPFGMIREYNKSNKFNLKTLNDFDLSGSLSDTNELREVAADNFFNEENNKNDEILKENKKFYWKSNKIKKAKQRAIEVNNKHFAKKQKNKNQKSMPKSSSSR